MSRIRLPKRLLLRGPRVIDPNGGIDGPHDLLIDGTTLEAMEPSLPAGVDALELRADGMIVAPGLQDMRVQLREPGDEDAETIHSGAYAAARGGFTHILTMPDTDPPVDQRGVIEWISRKAETACGTVVRPAAALTKGLEGQLLTEMVELGAAGALAVTNGETPVGSAEIMRRGMEYARGAGLIVIAHCEDRSLRGAGVMHEGYWSTVLGMRGVPAEAETIAIARDLSLCRLTGCRLHIAHVSSAGGVDLIRQAKTEGLPVTAETAPHYLAYTDASLKEYESSFKVNPPLRTSHDRDALKNGLRDGTIDVIASDHSPHPIERTQVEVDRAPFGVIGLETSLSVCISELVETKILDWAGLIHAMSTRVAGILGWGGGRLEVGQPADLMMIDPEAHWVVEASALASLSKNTPFEGRTLPGKVLLTLAEGRLTHMEPGLLG